MKSLRLNLTAVILLHMTILALP